LSITARILYRQFMYDTTLAFIGGGNMASSLIGGLIADGWDPQRITVSDRDSHQLEQLREHFGVVTRQGNLEAATGAGIVLLAVKPQIVREVALELAELLSRQHSLVISIAAGIRTDALRNWIGQHTAIVRSMPNTPALVQSGATALYANAAVTMQQHDVAETILRAVGLTIWLEDESLMDAVTALSGSGPAYFFLFMEALQKAGCALGLPEQAARLLTLQTALGAARMAIESTEDPATLRRRVTSPGGTTERAIQSFQQHDFDDLVLQALEAAAARSAELAEQFGKQ
jgi:pyrroline-5-carboxylate reductase